MKNSKKKIKIRVEPVIEKDFKGIKVVVPEGWLAWLIQKVFPSK